MMLLNGSKARADQNGVRAWHNSIKEADEAFARDPEGQVAAALAAWMMNVLDTHLNVLDQEIDVIRLLISNDKLYRGPANARYANIGAILAGLLAEESRDIGFLMPVVA